MVDFGIIPTAEASVVTLMKSIDRVIINPIIFFLFALAMVYFLYGLAQYLLSPGNEEVHKRSKSVMLWGIIGLFIMVAVFGIMKIILNTVGENKIKINSNGDYVVNNDQLVTKGSYDANTGVLSDTNVVDDKRSGAAFDTVNEVKDLTKIVGAADLPPETFTTSPFGTYQADALCWNFVTYNKASTEFTALSSAKTAARKKYLSDNGILDTDKTKKEYPMAFATKVLYDKGNEKAKIAPSYYAWLDARAPIKTGTLANCSLKLLTPAKTIPSAAITSEANLSSTLEKMDLPIDFFTGTPFPTYEQKVDLCWEKQILGKANTEYLALDLARTSARNQYLKDNGILASDVSKINYPVAYATQTLYDRRVYDGKEGMYYVWIDSRAPIKKGVMSDCSLKVKTEARVVPETTLFSKKVATTDEINLSETVLKNHIKDFTKSPFLQKYVANPLCWRKELYGKAGTEYTSSEQAKIKARMQYISENNLNENTTAQNLPIKYGEFIAYDKVSKSYYDWLDVRAPIGKGVTSDCSLIPILDPSLGIPQLHNQSGKKNPITNIYKTDDKFYRVVDSGADPDYSIARNTAITNALIQIAHLAGLDRLNQITTYTVLEEKYYKKDLNTGNYDYWVAVEVPTSI